MAQRLEEEELRYITHRQIKFARAYSHANIFMNSKRCYGEFTGALQTFTDKLILRKQIQA